MSVFVTDDSLSFEPSSAVMRNLTSLLDRKYAGMDYAELLALLNPNSSRDRLQSTRDQYHRDMLAFSLMGVTGMVICCLGLIGNFMSLVVLTRKAMRSSTYSYLSALSVTDSLMLLCTMILLVRDLHPPVWGDRRWSVDDGFYPYLFPILHPTAFTFQVTSIWLTLAFTVDRYIMICHPFSAEPFCTVSRARKVILALVTASILFNIPKYFEYKTVVIPLPNNRTRTGLDLTSHVGKSPIFKQLYHSWFYIAFVVGLPFLALGVLNSCLMHAVRLSRRRGREINVAERKRNDTTIMLIGTVVIFFICQTPALVSRVIWAFEPDTIQFKEMNLYVLNEAGNFMIILNSSINIVPYYFFGKRFRKEFKLVFCQWLYCLWKNRPMEMDLLERTIHHTAPPADGHVTLPPVTSAARTDAHARRGNDVTEHAAAAAEQRTPLTSDPSAAAAGENTVTLATECVTSPSGGVAVATNGHVTAKPAEEAALLRAVDGRVAV